MSRRTPIRELIDEDSVSVPGSPRRKSSRLAAKVQDEKETSTPIAKSKEETSDPPARRRRRASTSSLNEEPKIVASPAPRNRRSTRSMSTSPTANLEAGISTPAKSKGRRLSITDKVNPLNAIEEKEKDDTLEVPQEIPDPDSTTENEDNLPFKKKRKTLNLQTIEEKSFIEDHDKSNTEIQNTVDTEILSKKPLPRFSLEKLQSKEESDEKSTEEKELVDILNKSSNSEDHNIEEEVQKNISKPVDLDNSMNASSDSVFDSSIKENITKQPLLNNKSIDDKIESKNEHPELDNEQKLVNGGSKNERVDDKVVSTEVEANKLVNENGEVETNKSLTDSEQPVVNGGSENERVDDKVVSTEVEVNKLDNENGKVETDKSLTDSEQPVVEDKLQNGVRDSPVENELPDTNQSIPDSPKIPDKGTPNRQAHQDTNFILLETPVISNSPKLNESRTRKVSNRKSLSDSEEYLKKPLSTVNSTPLSIISANKVGNDLVNEIKETLQEKNLNISGSSDVSDKENQNLNISNSRDENQKNRTFTGKAKELSIVEPMEVEYASDVSVCIVEPKAVIPSHRLSAHASEDLIHSSTPKKTVADVSMIDTSVLDKKTVVVNVTSPKVLNDPEMSTSKTERNTLPENNASIADESELDPDEYEENHPSIIDSNDEEIAAAERKTYSKTISNCGTPERTLLSQATVTALVNVEDSEKSDDPDFEPNASENDHTFENLHAKIADLIANHEGEESSSGESEGSVTHFLDEFAEEGEEDTPSEGSNDIIEKGESIGSRDTDDQNSNDSYGNDSFIDDNEEHELLSGSEYDLDTKCKGKHLTRILPQIESEDEVVENGDVPQDDDLEKMSTRPYCGLSPPSIISVRDSPTFDDNKIENSPSVLINKEDNLQSLEEIKQKSPVPHIAKVEESTQVVKNLKEANTPNNSLTEDPKTRKRLSSIHIVDNITVDDIEQGGIGDRINKVIDAFYSNVKENSLNSSGNFSLNISVDCIEDSKVEQIAVVSKHAKEALSTSLTDKVHNSPLLPKSKTITPKKLELKLEKAEDHSEAVISKIPIRNKEDNAKKRKAASSDIDSQKTTEESDNPKQVSERMPIIVLNNEEIYPKSKKAKVEIHSVSVFNNIAEKPKKPKPNKKVQIEIEPRAFSEELVSEIPVKKRKTRGEAVPVVEQPKKFQKSNANPNRIIRTTINDSEWVIEETKISYFPSSILNTIAETKVNAEGPCKPKLVPSTSDSRKSWGNTRAVKKLLPSTNSASESFSNKDLKNKMIFDPSRVKRMDAETYLKKNKNKKF